MSLTTLREMMVLGAIRAHPSHGYALAEMLEDGLGGTVGLTRATVYATLRRFEKRGWVTSVRQKESKLPERQIFDCTDAGDEAYARLLAECASEEPGIVFPLVALLAHLDDLPQDERRDALEGLHGAREEELRRLEQFLEHEGAAGVAMQLLVAQLRLELDAIAALLD